MNYLHIILITFVINYATCQFHGVYVNTGGCPNYTPATNIDTDKISTLWTASARSKISYLETQLDCTRISIILNNMDKNELAIYARPRGTDTIRGHQAGLGNQQRSQFGYYKILNPIGVRPLYIKGSIWILNTDNESFCILIMCNTQNSIGYSYVYVLTRGIMPDNMLQITNQTLQANKLNPDGLIWGLDRNC